MSAFVVDTNVPVVANGRSEQADFDCVLACIDKLEEITNGGVVVLDDGMRILREYMDNLSMKGQPGPGDGFMKWVWQHQAVAERCEQVTIQPTPKDDHDFEEFPRDPALSDFDRADRKFVAVALASRRAPTVLNAVDLGWWTHLDALRAHGVRVEFLCPQCMQTRL